MLLRRLYSTAFWGFLVVSSALLFPVAVVIWALTAPFDRRKVVLHRFTCWWASLYTWGNPLWPVTVQGRERIDDGDACVFIANHLSLLDILVLFRLFRHFKWVSKVENFKVPLIGWNMRLNGYIPLVRGDRNSAREMMRACERTLEEGSSLMMFPEGTRSRDGRLQPFKTGAFQLALGNRVPLQPIVLRGTQDALPKRGFLLRGRHPIEVTVLDRIPPEQFGTDDPRELADRIHALFARHLEADAREQRGEGSAAG